MKRRARGACSLACAAGSVSFPIGHDLLLIDLAVEAGLAQGDDDLAGVQVAAGNGDVTLRTGPVERHFGVGEERPDRLVALATAGVDALDDDRVDLAVGLLAGL